MRIARSIDGGEHWSDPVTPHADGTATEHGFVSYYVSPEGRLGAVWLDGRKTGGAGHDEAGHGDSGAMTLRTGILHDAGSDELELDNRTCDCCQTDAASTPTGAAVVYRDRSDDEIRDIALVRLVNGEWLTPKILARDGWQIAACPVNGPAIASRGERMAVAWFTMSSGQPAVRLIRSADSGETFDAPVTIDDEQPLGRVDLAMLDDGSLLLSWMLLRGDDALVRVAHIDGDRVHAVDAGATDAARSSGFPRLASDGRTSWLVWRGMQAGVYRLQLAELSVNRI